MAKISSTPTLSNNGMHPTRDTQVVKFLRGAGGRVMPGVMPLTDKPMSGAGEQKQKYRGEWWVTPALILAFIILRDILELWLAKPAAAGVATLAAMFILYKYIPNPQLRFGRWAILSLVFTTYFVAAFFGVPKLLCSRVGAVWTWGLLVAGFFLSLRWLSILPHRDVEDSPWEWLAVSIGAGCTAAFFAYINPEGFCR